MKIKCILGDKQAVVTLEWLLKNYEEDLIEKMVCGKCDIYKQTIVESYEPMCYGECIDSFIEKNENEEIRFEVLNERV